MRPSGSKIAQFFRGADMRMSGSNRHILRAGLVAGVLATLLAACAGGRDQPIAKRIYELHPGGQPSPEHFVICSGHGCYERHDVHLSEGQWEGVRSVFAQAPANAEEERKLIGLAVSKLEKLAGAQTGTDADLGGTYSNFWLANQLDCADETVNTTTYLKLLMADGLIAKHRLGGRLHKGDIIDYLPHMAPTIIDQETGTQWVVDSWYLDHGEPPEITTAALWHTDYETWGSTGKPARP
ncbi:hypothetical protein BN1012_Phect2194 [Candidatus Phaeomarinobacter ectocarpi]|uniref:Uncharacterized protein n=2 Tax=Candidatus Phaeomarinibacter ectocarpi TaxID=1458461 RepID=X5MDR4_9HYPH|nr:hypothetical protein BN1012_Phect2194 [Candidatus Phaeomarinobacter ectocarpi]